MSEPAPSRPQSPSSTQEMEEDINTGGKRKNNEETPDPVPSASAEEKSDATPSSTTPVETTAGDTGESCQPKKLKLRDLSALLAKPADPSSSDDDVSFSTVVAAGPMPDACPTAPSSPEAPELLPLIPGPDEVDGHDKAIRVLDLDSFFRDDPNGTLDLTSEDGDVRPNIFCDVTLDYYRAIRFEFLDLAVKFPVLALKALQQQSEKIRFKYLDLAVVKKKRDNALAWASEIWDLTESEEDLPDFAPPSPETIDLTDC